MNINSILQGTIYTSFVAEDIAQSLIVVQNCMLAIQVWMNQNILEPNPSKTEFMIIGNLTDLYF